MIRSEALFFIGSGIFIVTLIAGAFGLTGLPAAILGGMSAVPMLAGYLLDLVTDVKDVLAQRRARLAQQR